MEYQLTTLKNNLKTLFVNLPGSTAGTVQIWFRAGSALEENSNEGIAHFLEHMFFKGTANRPGAKIAHEVETFGGEINAFTSFDYTCYYINTPNANLATSVEILLDMVSAPLFKEEDLIPERGVVFEEYRRSLDSANQFGFSMLQKTAFTGAYAHPILGNEKTIKNFTREQLEYFRNNNYNLQNAIFLVAGDLGHKDALIELIEKFQLPSGKESTFPEFQLKSTEAYGVHEKEVRMSTLTLVLNAPAFSEKNAPAEDLAINCLGFGETSRLYKSLVLEKTLANHASASTMFMAHGGAHFIRLSFPHENLKPLLKKLEEIFISTLKEGLSNEEITKIKNQYLSSKIYERESIESFSFSLGHSFAQTGNINSDEEFINRIKKTSTNEVNSSLKNIFKKTLHLSLQIPKGQKKKMAEKEIKTFQLKMKKIKTSLKKEASLNFKITTSKFDSAAKVLKISPGVSLFYRQNTMTPTFVLQAYIRGGVTEETNKTMGLYQLLSSSITKGYGKISHEKMKKDLEEKSASLSGFAGKNAYGLLMHGLSENFEELAAHFKGTLSTPTMPKKHIDHELKLTLRALESQKEDPVKHCFQKANELFFTTHPYAFNPLGKKETLNKINSKTLIDLHKKNLNKKEILISYCGDADLSEVLDTLQDLFVKLPIRKSIKPVYKTYKSKTNTEAYISFDREQTQIFYGIPCAKSNSIENIYLKMLSTHLSGQSSELFVEVRDRQGLCYSAQPVHFSALEGGYFGIYMASGHDKVTKALLAIKDLIKKIKEHGLPEEDFERIKKMIKGQTLINVQTNEDFASVYSVPLLQGEDIDYYHKKNIQIESLTHKDFQKNIKDILSQKWNTIIVGRENAQAK